MYICFQCVLSTQWPCRAFVYFAVLLLLGLTHTGTPTRTHTGTQSVSIVRLLFAAHSQYIFGNTAENA